MTFEVRVPDIGDYQDIPVIDILVKTGDHIAAEDPLITLESDKATMDVPAPQAGVVTAVQVKLGDKVSQGSLVLLLEPLAGAAKTEAGAAKTEAGAATAAPAAVAAAPVAPAPAAAHAAPAAPAAAVHAASAATAFPSAASAASGATGTLQVAVPDIGDYADIPVIDVLVKEGDSVNPEDALVTLESDKATMDVPCPAKGVVRKLLLKVGDRVSQGTLVLELEIAATVPAAAAAAAATAAVSSPATAPADPAAPAAPAVALAAANPSTPPAASAAAGSSPVAAGRAGSAAAAQVGDQEAAQLDLSVAHASPTIRRLARELGVNLLLVKGTGPKDRITEDDVKAFVKQAMLTRPATAASAAAPAGAGGLDLLPWPTVDFTKFGAVEVRPLSRIKKISGANLHRNWVRIPHVTNQDEADITDLEALRNQLNGEMAKSGVKLTALAFLIKAVTVALKKYPEFNASLDGDNLVLKRYYHIGFAADTPNGLVVPVLRNADQKGVLDIARESAELAAKAREGKLGPADMQGGCFSISSLGGIGGGHFTPIINAPEVAILGVGRSTMKPVWDGASFQPRLMLPLSLSYDHRVIDGALAARFNALLGSLLADMRRALL